MSRIVLLFRERSFVGLLPVFLVLILLSSCTILLPREGYGDDDDIGGDGSGEDDEDTPDDSDDGADGGGAGDGDVDVDGDDDDDDDDAKTEYLDIRGLGFNVSMEVTPDGELGDDDDSVGEAAVIANFYVRYFQDIGSNTVLCQQRMHVEGVGTFGPGTVSAGGCSNCTGILVFDPETVVDLSDPTTNETDCDPVALDAIQSNYGDSLLSGVVGGGFGDFLNISLFDATTMDSLDLSLSSDFDFGVAEMSLSLQEYGMEFTHGGYTLDVAGTFADAVNLSGFAGSAGDESNWYGFWRIYKDPKYNTHTGSAMNGIYMGDVIWGFPTQ